MPFRGDLLLAGFLALLLGGCSVGFGDFTPSSGSLREQTVESGGATKIVLMDVPGMLSDEGPTPSLSAGGPPPRVPMLVRIREEAQQGGERPTGARAHRSEIARTLKLHGVTKVQVPTVAGIRRLYHQARRGFRDGKGFEVGCWTIPAWEALYSSKSGTTTSRCVDCYLGIGLQPGRVVDAT